MLKTNGLIAFFLLTLLALYNCSSKVTGTNDVNKINNQSKTISLLPNNEPNPDNTKTKFTTVDLSKIPTVTYCELVKNAAEYDHKIVRLRAIYFY